LWHWASPIAQVVARMVSSSRVANGTPQPAASGRRAHQRCSVLGCPWRIDFSRADASLLALSGRATSISFFLMLATIPVSHVLKELGSSGFRVGENPGIATRSDCCCMERARGKGGFSCANGGRGIPGVGTRGPHSRPRNLYPFQSLLVRCPGPLFFSSNSVSCQCHYPQETRKSPIP
jgi:hypothetical protein